MRECPECTRPVRDGAEYCPWCKHYRGVLHKPTQPRQLTTEPIGRRLVSSDLVDRLVIWNDAPPMGSDDWRQGYAAACRDVLRCIGEEVNEP